MGKSLSIRTEHIPAPDAEECLVRAFDVILRAAVRAEAAETQQVINAQQAKEEDLGHV